MRIKLRLCQILSYYADNRQLVEVNGNTVSECLNNLATQFPDIRKMMETVKEGDELKLIFHMG
ncbi:MAG: hypothetical protein PHY28_02065 [Dehalococcoidales bacterium]|nr:hypothetical protein [Dehalococcoidales bacterium]